MTQRFEGLLSLRRPLMWWTTSHASSRRPEFLLLSSDVHSVLYPTSILWPHNHRMWCAFWRKANEKLQRPKQMGVSRYPIKPCAGVSSVFSLSTSLQSYRKNQWRLLCSADQTLRQSHISLFIPSLNDTIRYALTSFGNHTCQTGINRRHIMKSFLLLTIPLGLLGIGCSSVPTNQTIIERADDVSTRPSWASLPQNHSLRKTGKSIF